MLDGEETSLIYAEDYILSPSASKFEVDVSGPLVFVGYGVVAPELEYDDYGSMDVRGKVVAYLSGAPITFPSNQRAFYSSGSVKREEARVRGAIGVVSFTSPDDPRFRWQVSVNRSKRGAFSWLDQNGQPNVAAGIDATASLNHQGVVSLFRGFPHVLG